MRVMGELNPELLELLTLSDEVLDTRAAELSLYEFVRQAWHVVEPGVPFIESWHIQLICEHLEAISRGEIQRLLINIPPRHSKSTIVSVMWPMWEWISYPQAKFLCASYSGVLSIRDNLKSRRLVSSPWYQQRWGGRFVLAGDQNVKQRYENSMTGYRIATSVGGTATGEGGSRLVLDDPHGAQDAQSDAMRESALEWFDMVWSTRLNNPKTDAMVTIMQRLHEADISGHILKRGGWEHICIPAEWDGTKRKTVLGAYDPRTKPGELICPERFDRKQLDELKQSLGEYGTSGQLQQKPTPDGGGIINTQRFKLWPSDRELPPFHTVVQGYDTAFTQKTSGDPTAMQAWGVFTHKGKRCVMLLDCWTDHLAYPALRQRVIDEWSAVYGKSIQSKGYKADVVLVENKGSGQALLNDLNHANVRATSYDLPRGQRAELSKVARAHIVTPIIDEGLIYLMESTKSEGQPVTWARSFVDECRSFPVAEHDDQVDVLTMILTYLKDSGWFELPEAAQDAVEERDYHTEKRKRANPYAQ